MKLPHRDEEHGWAAFTRGGFESKQGPGFGEARATLKKEAAPIRSGLPVMRSTDGHPLREGASNSVLKRPVDVSPIDGSAPAPLQGETG